MSFDKQRKLQHLFPKGRCRAQPPSGQRVTRCWMACSALTGIDLIIVQIILNSDEKNNVVTPTTLMIIIFVGTHWGISSTWRIASLTLTKTYTSSTYSSNLLPTNRSCSIGTSLTTIHWSSKVSIGSMNPMGPSRRFVLWAVTL
jgi:hypothetical protein